MSRSSSQPYWPRWRFGGSSRCKNLGRVPFAIKNGSNFVEGMHATIINKTFLVLMAIIFTLAMGFNFVGSFGSYITIFYLYGGDVQAASTLLGITGTVWAV